MKEDSLDVVDGVALWAGLIAGIVSTVLAIVAIAFTWAVDRRSSEINRQMIQSLQKIESSVEKVSDDTSDLIKVAWERLLPGADSNTAGPSAIEEATVRAIAAGVSAELKADLTQNGQSGAVQAQHLAELDSSLAQIESTLRSTLRASTSRPDQSVDTMVKLLRDSSREARELVRILVDGRHLTRSEYAALRHTDLGDVLDRLRRRGVIVPLQSQIEGETGKPVYWFSPRSRRDTLAALTLVDEDSAAREVVSRTLRSVGYPVAE